MNSMEPLLYGRSEYGAQCTKWNRYLSVWGICWHRQQLKILREKRYHNILHTCVACSVPQSDSNTMIYSGPWQLPLLLPYELWKISFTLLTACYLYISWWFRNRCARVKENCLFFWRKKIGFVSAFDLNNVLNRWNNRGNSWIS